MRGLQELILAGLIGIIKAFFVKKKNKHIRLTRGHVPEETRFKELFVHYNFRCLETGLILCFIVDY